MKTEKYRLYRRSFDEETREVGYSWAATFPERESAEEYAAWLRSRCSPWAGHRICGPGEPAPKGGWGTEREQTRRLCDMFDGLCPEEQDAYLGK